MIICLQQNRTLGVKMRPVEFIIKEGEAHLTSHCGLAMIGALLHRTQLASRVDSTILPGMSDTWDSVRRR